MTILFSKRFLSLLRAWIRLFLLGFFVCPCSARFSLNVTQRRQNTFIGTKERFRPFFRSFFLFQTLQFLTESVLLLHGFISVQYALYAIAKDVETPAKSRNIAKFLKTSISFLNCGVSTLGSFVIA